MNKKTRRLRNTPKWRLAVYLLQSRAVTSRVRLRSSGYVITHALYKEGLVRSASLSVQVTVGSNKHLSQENWIQTGSAEGTDQTSWVIWMITKYYICMECILFHTSQSSDLCWCLCAQSHVIWKTWDTNTDEYVSSEIKLHGAKCH